MAKSSGNEYTWALPLERKQLQRDYFKCKIVHRDVDCLILISDLPHQHQTMVKGTGPKTDPWGTSLINDLQRGKAVGHNSLAAILQPNLYLLKSPPFKSISFQFRYKNVVWVNVKGLAEEISLHITGVYRCITGVCSHVDKLFLSVKHVLLNFLVFFFSSFSSLLVNSPLNTVSCTHLSLR